MSRGASASALWQQRPRRPEREPRTCKECHGRPWQRDPHPEERQREEEADRDRLLTPEELCLRRPEEEWLRQRDRGERHPEEERLRLFRPEELCLRRP